MKHYGDITKLNGAELPVVDVITGGSPCQDLSVAGKREGLTGERSGLFMEQIRIVKEMREHDRRTGRTGKHIRPRFMVWENVPGAFSSNKGEDFRIVLEEVTRIADGNAVIPRPADGWTPSGVIMGNGWSVAWRVHDAQFWGVPQRRKRIALVADFGGESATEILFEREGLRGCFKTSGKTGKEIAKDTKRCADQAISFQERAWKPGGGKGILIQRERTGALSTLNNQCVFSIDEKIGQTYIGDDVGNTLWARDYKQTQAVVYGMSAYNSNAMKSSNPKAGIYKADTSRTLDINGGNPACNQGGMLVVEGKKHESLISETVGALCASDYKGIRNQSIDDDKCLLTNAVRRLTPIECERLQGFPDDWTNLGEWTDTKGKRHKESDAPRYKALGNSIALPFWDWLVRRISAQYEHPATLGSLFDGIGGFPLVWERCNGKGTAIWASEIEEFCIAVTKKHFGE